MATKRKLNLDFLRGSLSILIMIYHFLQFSYYHIAENSILKKTSFFAVSTFYVLSGLVIYLNYGDKFNLRKYVIKRFFRIMPLFWLVTFLAIYLKDPEINYEDLFLNLTGLFGFFKWDIYYSAGLWSIGNEIVFYTFFPLIILLLRNKKNYWLIFTFFVTINFFYFSFFMIEPEKPLSLQWRQYINPLNQFFFFYFGMIIAKVFSNISISNSFSNLFIVLGISVFCFLPENNYPVYYGLNRIFYSFSILFVVLGFFKINNKSSNNKLDKVFRTLGDISYSIYLLHPIVWEIASFIIYSKINYILPLDIFKRTIILSIFTIAISLFTYNIFESYFINKAKKIS